MNARQVPNLVTFSRLALAVVAFYFLERMLFADITAGDRERAAFWAFWFYLVAAATDVVDGWLARRYGWVTALGRVADPVVDKVLTLGALVYLAVLGYKDLLRPDPYLAAPGDIGKVMPVWAVVVILTREFLVTTLRGVIEKKGTPFPADRFGKIKMVLQTIYVLILIGAAGAIPERLGLPFLIYLRDPWVVIVVFWAMVGLTIFSGLNYCRRAAGLLGSAEA